MIIQFTTYIYERFDYTNRLKIIIKTRPLTDMIVSRSVHVSTVSLMDNPKYSLNIQNPASFTCDAMTLPAPVARTTNAKFTSDASSNGITIPVVEIAATVADPNAILSTAATSQANRIGEKSECVNNVSTCLPTPPSINTCLNAPPAPIIRIIIPIG